MKQKMKHFFPPLRLMNRKEKTMNITQLVKKAQQRDADAFTQLM